MKEECEEICHTVYKNVVEDGEVVQKHVSVCKEEITCVPKEEKECKWVDEVDCKDGEGDCKLTLNCPFNVDIDNTNCL